MSNPALSFAKPTSAHIAWIAGHIRPGDRAEIWLSHKFDPAEGLEASVRWSKDDCFVALGDTVPVAIFGVASGSLTSTVGSPWMIGTNALVIYRREIAALSRPMVEYLRGGYTLLENWVHQDNMISVRWLRGCGFTIEPAAPYGPFGAPFHRFWMPGELKSCASQPQ